MSTNGDRVTDNSDWSMTRALENLTEAPNYQAWLTSLAEPFLGDNPIELGSGIGNYAAIWLSHGLPRITLTEIDPERRAILQQRFAGESRVTVTELDIHSPWTGDHSALVSFNVLEHIEDDVAALAAAKSVVRPGGYVIHLVPAFMLAMSEYDHELGHYRRYRKKPLRNAALRAGLIVDTVHYLNAPGLIAWFVKMRLLKQRPTPGTMLRSWDSGVIRAERWIESKVRAPFGQSVVLIARTPS